MHFPGRDMDHIANPEDLRRLPTRAYQSHAHGHGEDLPEFMLVPERPGPRREAHVVGHAAKLWGAGVGGGLKDGVHVDRASEGFGGLAGGVGGLVRGAD
jgi:hypothetical protein